MDVEEVVYYAKKVNALVNVGSKTCMGTRIDAKI